MSGSKVPALVSELIFRQVKQGPNQPALLYAGQEVSYQQLWNSALGWAHAVRPLISEPETIIGVLQPRGTAVPACHLAAWIVGAAYLPIDPALPPGRIEALLTQAGCDVILTTPALIELLPSNVTAITEPSTTTDTIELQPHAARLAYVMGTSGTTGAPKCVEVEHGSLALLVEWYREFFDLGPNVRTPMLACLDRDGLIMDEWATLTAGGTIAIPTEGAMASPAAIGAFLTENRVEHAYIPAPLIEGFLVTDQRPSPLRSIYTGSDRLRVWPASDYTAGVYNGYGPTEATVTATTTGDLREERNRTDLPTLGKAIPGVELWLETPDGEKITEPGVTGEVMIGGPFVARGYRHQPDLTVAAFTQDANGTRYYRTGDICAWTEQGELAFIGRRDRQIKTRGLRTELGEVEQVILGEPGVRSVIVTVLGEGAESRLEALVEGTGVTREALKARLENSLPKAMIPESIRFVGEVQRPGEIAETAALTS